MVESPWPRKKSVIRKLIQQLDGAITGEASLEAEKCSQVEPEKRESPEVNVAEPLEESTVGHFAEPPDQSFVASTVPVTSESVRVSASKLDTLLLQAEEMIAVKLATGERAAELTDLKKGVRLVEKGDAKTRRQCDFAESPYKQYFIIRSFYFFLRNQGVCYN